MDEKATANLLGLFGMSSIAEAKRDVWPWWHEEESPYVGAAWPDLDDQSDALRVIEEIAKREPLRTQLQMPSERDTRWVLLVGSDWVEGTHFVHLMGTGESLREVVSRVLGVLGEAAAMRPEFDKQKQQVRADGGLQSKFVKISEGPVLPEPEKKP